MAQRALRVFRPHALDTVHVTVGSYLAQSLQGGGAARSGDKQKFGFPGNRTETQFPDRKPTVSAFTLGWTD
jgi:hypothetical protein